MQTGSPRSLNPLFGSKLNPTYQHFQSYPEIQSPKHHPSPMKHPENPSFQECCFLLNSEQLLSLPLPSLGPSSSSPESPQHPQG